MNIERSFSLRCFEAPFVRLSSPRRIENVVGRKYIMQRRAIISSQQCGDTAMSIRYILSDKLLSLNFKENLHNVG